jgi:hypothetical protein
MEEIPMNPNEYDDDAFTDASNEFQGNATEMFERLWRAGASAEEIINEINTALNSAGIASTTRIGDRGWSTARGPLTLAET